MLIGISGKIGSGKDTVGKYLQYLYSSEYPRHTFEEFKEYPRWINADDWQIKKYADKLKEIVCLLIGCTREQLEDSEFKNQELGEEWWYYFDPSDMLTLRPYLEWKDAFSHHFLVKLTPRLLLQILGTEAGREIIHPNIWVNALFADYKFIEVLPNTDTGLANYNPKYNFPNWIITDVRFPNEADAIKERGGILIRLTRTTPVAEEVAKHESETALDNYDKFDYIIDNSGTEEELYTQIDKLAQELLPLLNQTK